MKKITLLINAFILISSSIFTDPGRVLDSQQRIKETLGRAIREHRTELFTETLKEAHRLGMEHNILKNLSRRGMSEGLFRNLDKESINELISFYEDSHIDRTALEYLNELLKAVTKPSPPLQEGPTVERPTIQRPEEPEIMEEVEDVEEPEEEEEYGGPFEVIEYMPEEVLPEIVRSKKLYAWALSAMAMVLIYMYAGDSIKDYIGSIAAVIGAAGEDEAVEVVAEQEVTSSDPYVLEYD